MKKKFLILSCCIIFLATSVFVTSCNKGCENPPEIPHEVLKYFYFDTGSKWIYQRTDTTAAVYDTAIVTLSDFEINSSNSPNPCGENFVCLLEHNYENFKNYTEYIGFQPVDRSTFLVNVHYYSNNFLLTFDGAFNGIILPTETASFQDNYEVNNTNYSNVLVVDNQTFKYVYAPNIGVIQYVFEGKTWELINHSVTQSHLND